MSSFAINVTLKKDCNSDNEYHEGVQATEMRMQIHNSAVL